MIVELLGGIRATTFAALACLLLVVAGVQHIEVGHYKTSAVTLQSAVKTFQSAQKTNLATIAALLAANQQWAHKSAADVAATAKAVRDAKTYAETQQRAALKAQKALRDAYAAHPQVKAWADVAVPDAMSRILRQQAGYPH